jgi:dUTP pyrophosphatase
LIFFVYPGNKIRVLFFSTVAAYLCDHPMTVDVQIINKSPHPLPDYHTLGASGMDIRAWLPEPVTLASMERRLIPTGLYMALPHGFEAQIRPRSGLSIKRGLTLINTPGTIDSDYRGEIMIPLVNLSAEAQIINDGERIAQMIVTTYTRVVWSAVDALAETERGSGGFGHSGIN